MSQDRELAPRYDPKRVKYVVENYKELQGLRHAAAGVPVLVFGILQTPLGNVESEASPFPLLLMLLIPASFWLEYRLRKYYERKYGYVQERRDGWSELVVTVLFLAGIVGSVWLHIVADPPIAIIGLPVAALFLYRGHAGYLYRAHWTLFGLLLLGLTVLPLLPLSQGYLASLGTRSS